MFQFYNVPILQYPSYYAESIPNLEITDSEFENWSFFRFEKLNTWKSLKWKMKKRIGLGKLKNWELKMKFRSGGCLGGGAGGCPPSFFQNNRYINNNFNSDQVIVGLKFRCAPPFHFRFSILWFLNFSRFTFWVVPDSPIFNTPVITWIFQYVSFQI